MKTPVTNTRPAEDVAKEAFQSRWGWHAVDYPTFLMIRRLHKAYQKALHGYHVWLRWRNKSTNNRIVRRWARNGKGQKVGYTVEGLQPEPPLCPIFTRKVKRENRYGVWLYNERLAPKEEAYEVVMDDKWILNAMQSRYPAPEPGQVKEIALQKFEIEALAWLLTQHELNVARQQGKTI